MCNVEKIFRSRFILINLLVFLVFKLYSQTYVLNEDFSSASGTTPPTGWTNANITGNSTDVWHFDNPGNRAPGFPIIGTFAIFDSENYSQSGGPEKAQIESPFIDCSISPSILMYFDHYFVGGNGGSGKIEVYDGTNWNTAATYTDSTVGVESALLDISSYAGGITNAKVRLEWEGDSSYYWAVDNLQIYAPLTYDAAITTIQNPVMPFSAATQNIEVDLINSGAVTMTTATIQWEVNGILQTPYSWSGSLSMGTSTNNIVIGSYTFPDGVIQNIKVWVEQPNGQQDLNALNDTTQAALAAGLCGTYTIGGVSPDFLNFTDAAYVLNNAGISCPVVFNVRDTIYDEQIKIYDVQGSSSVNTITFNGESGDSSVAGLHYQNSNPSNDFSLALVGTHNIFFNDLTIARSNGSTALNIQGGAHDVTVVNSYFTGDVVSPDYSDDTSLVFVGNNILNNKIELKNSSKSGSVLIQSNMLRELYLDNFNSVDFSGNQMPNDQWNNNYSSADIQNSLNINITNNELRRVYLYRDSILTITGNSFWDYSGWHNDHIYLNESFNAQVSLNKYTSWYRSVRIRNTSNVNIFQDSTLRQRYGSGYLIEQSSRNISITDNYFRHSDNHQGNFMEIYNSPDSIYIKRNVVVSENSVLRGDYEIYYDCNYPTLMEIDSNYFNSRTKGFRIRNYNNTANIKIRHNTLDTVGEYGMDLIEIGDTLAVIGNVINKVNGGDGIKFSGSSSKINISKNKVLGVTAGSGIVVDAPNSLVANNYVQSEGVGLAKGISLEANGSGSDIVFNSVNVTGTDVVNGQGIAINGGTNCRVKNNIFANNGGGYAAYINSDISTFDWDFNNYYSSGTYFGNYQGTSYNNLNTWGPASSSSSSSSKSHPSTR